MIDISWSNWIITNCVCCTTSQISTEAILEANLDIDLNNEQVMTQTHFAGQRSYQKKMNVNCKKWVPCSSRFKMLVSEQLTDNVTMKKVMKHVFIPTPCVLDFFALSTI